MGKSLVLILFVIVDIINLSVLTIITVLAKVWAVAYLIF